MPVQDKKNNHSALARRTGRHLRRPMVRWLDPRLLLKTLFTLVVAKLFAAYADRRERDVSRPPDGPYRYDQAQSGNLHNQDGVWLDYIADLGDGWDSTTTMAGLLAQPVLTLDGRILPHGRVLVMGGDLAYPVASRDEYLHRTEAPYYSVLPYSPESAPRDLFVLPGNHDWYDSLATFSRLFLQQRWFAGWRTRQTRSYFVLRLPQRWWFVAVDVQLDNDVDIGQLEYLQAATRDLAAGDCVILAGAVPFWLEDENSVLRRNLAFIERQLFTDRGARVFLSLAGDLHHYQRHARSDGAQRIISGGGGAFLHGTAWQPEVLEDAVVDGQPPDRWLRQATFPSPAASRLALWRLLFFPGFNPSFAVFLGAMATLLLWGVDAAGYGLFFRQLSAGFGSAAWSLLETLPMSPILTAALLGWFAAFVAFEDPPEKWHARWRAAARTGLGVLHAALHLLLALWIASEILPVRSLDPFTFFGNLLLLWLVLALANGLLFGIWIYVSYQLLGCHADTAFSACRIADWKNFLRMHISADGTLTLYVIGVQRVCRRWHDRQPVARGEAFVEPGDGISLASRATLVETLVIKPESGGVRWNTLMSS